jgi:hypothetical protein
MAENATAEVFTNAAMANMILRNLYQFANMWYWSTAGKKFKNTCWQLQKFSRDDRP